MKYEIQHIHSTALQRSAWPICMGGVLETLCIAKPGTTRASERTLAVIGYGSNLDNPTDNNR